MNRPLRALALVCAKLLCGCVVLGDAGAPIQTLLVPAPQASAERALIVVLPGFGIGADSVRDARIPEALHAQWPQADVLLTSAAFDYYRRGTLPARLHADVVAPARAQGYREVWLAGGSMGGAGVLFYELAHPGEADGLILLAPWLGSSKVHEEIEAAGGLARWEPGPAPAALDEDNFDRELWRLAKRWSADPAQASRVWLACGTDDWLIGASRLFAQALPAHHYVELPGRHDWDTFRAAATQIVGRLRAERATVAER